VSSHFRFRIWKDDEKPTSLRRRESELLTTRKLNWLKVPPLLASLGGGFRRSCNNRFSETAHMQIPLGKSNLDSRFPKTPVNFLVKLAFYTQHFISIQHPNTKLEVERALPETLKQHLRLRAAAIRLFVCCCCSDSPGNEPNLRPALSIPVFCQSRWQYLSRLLLCSGGWRTGPLDGKVIGRQPRRC